MESHFVNEAFESVDLILRSNYSNGIYSAVSRGPFIIFGSIFSKKDWVDFCFKANFGEFEA